ncbi:MAG: NCS2 family permease, partial [Bacteroidales bacterium]|nr:NCS2 family permease [Bacteroidales bacterium]
MKRFDRFFELKRNNTDVKTEIIAGTTTFMTMAYILAVNPGILAVAGMDSGAVFTATAIASLIATLVMAFWAKLPFALAPGMGINAFFAYTVVVAMGYSWQMALTAVFIEGIIFILLTLFNIREIIVNAFPAGLNYAISGGVGLFIAFIGLQNAGIIVHNDATLVSLGNMGSDTALIAIIGIFLTSVLLALKIKGALLIGIVVTTLLGIPFGLTHLPEGNLVSLPPSLEPVAFKFTFSKLFTGEMMIVIFTFLFVDMFNTVGTLVGVASKADMIDENGKLPRVKQALLADAIGTTVGAMLGTSTVTTYVESAAGVAEGGRTGLTAFTTAILFGLALFLAPLFLMVPACATAPALILVGSFMMSPVLKINFKDYTESIPAFLTLIIMPLSYSIAEGIVFGFISYVLLKLFSGKRKELSVVMYILAALFIAKFF